MGNEKRTRTEKFRVFFMALDHRRNAAAGVSRVCVDIHGKPISDVARSGGWVACFFIFGNEVAERMAYFGLAVNMVIYMVNVMHMPFSTSANAVNNFMGISQVSCVIGGFLADAYIGRYWTIAIFSTLYFVGVSGITLAAMTKSFAPNQADCNALLKLLGKCEPAKKWQMAYLFTSLYVTGLGSAGIRPCVSSFGADQFDESSEGYKSQLDKFFNFFYLAVTLGGIAAFTLVIYIQREHGWGAAFCTLAIAMAISNILFFIGTPLYRHRLPGGSPLSRVAQVLVASYRKRKLTESMNLYELQGENSAIKGSGKLPHTKSFKCLDKAAIRLDEDGVTPSPWRLCTVTQVEEVKILVKMAPIPACTIFLGVILTEFLTLSVQQAYTLDTAIGNLKLPVSCMPVFPSLCIFIVLTLYYHAFVPLSRRITGNPRGASQLQRMGIGLAVSFLSVAVAGVFEKYRRNFAIKHEYLYDFLSPMPLSAYWLLFQYCLIGIAEVFCLVGLLEFLYEEAPDAVKTVGSSFSALAGGLGCFAASILNNIVGKITGNVANHSWLSQNINEGRFDYFYWLLAVLSLLNLGVFMFCASRYEYRATEYGDPGNFQE